MILADTSIWVDHLRAGSVELAALLDAGTVLTHPLVIGELALGNLGRRADVLRLLSDLPHAMVATDTEVMGLIAQEALHSVGIGYVDAQLLAATWLTPDALLWTSDNQLSTVARRLGIGYEAKQRLRSH